MRIVVVTRNRENVLKRTLECMKARGLLAEVLILDGSDGKETETLCESLGVDHVQQESSGMTAARNEALEHLESDRVVFVDDDVIVSEGWFNAVDEALQTEDVVGVTGRLAGEESSLEGFSGSVRKWLFGGSDRFGEILGNGVVNGDFFYEEEKEVDHMPGCNMAFDVETLEAEGGFDEDFDVGTSWREDTAASVRVSRQGKIIYKPEAGLEHLQVGENRDRKRRLFYRAYLDRYFISKYDVLNGLSGTLRHGLVTLFRHLFRLGRSVSGSDQYLPYLKGEIRGIRDFVLRSGKPRSYSISSS